MIGFIPMMSPGGSGVRKYRYLGAPPLSPSSEPIFPSITLILGPKHSLLLLLRQGARWEIIVPAAIPQTYESMTSRGNLVIAQCSLEVFETDGVECSIYHDEGKEVTCLFNPDKNLLDKLKWKLK